MYLTRQTASEKKKNKTFVIGPALQLLILFSDSIVQVYCVWREGQAYQEKV